MKILSSVLLLLCCATLGMGPAQASSPAGEQSNAATAASSADLDRVLDQMDRAAANFKSAQADFVWDQYEKVVDTTDVQKGAIYFRRQGKELQMAANVSDVNGAPEQKYILFTDAKVQVYQPKIDQVTEYNAGKNRAAVETFLVLGFGGGGHELLKSFEVRYLGSEPVEGIVTRKLELTPKSQNVRNMFSSILLWIDPNRGVSLQQKLIEDSGNYRLTKFSNIKINQPLPDGVFKLKTTSHTKVLKPQA